MCLQSKHFTAMQESLNFIQAISTFTYESDGVVYTGPEAYVEQGIDFCRDNLKGRDEYAVPIFNSDGQIVNTAFVDVISGLGGTGAIDIISTTEVQQLVGSSTIPQYVSFSISAESHNLGLVKGDFSFWLVDDYAVDPKGDAIFQVVDLKGQPVHLLSGEVEPIVMLDNFFGMNGEDVFTPRLIYPVSLELIRVTSSQ